MSAASGPAQRLTGTSYEANPTDGAFQVWAPDSWVFRGTSVRTGSRFAHLVGPEYDRVDPVVTLRGSCRYRHARPSSQGNPHLLRHRLLHGPLITAQRRAAQRSMVAHQAPKLFRSTTRVMRPDRRPRRRGRRQHRTPHRRSVAQTGSRDTNARRRLGRTGHAQPRQGVTNRRSRPPHPVKARPPLSVVPLPVPSRRGTKKTGTR
jgi:hypothetical protein